MSPHDADAMRERSGSVVTDDPLVAFLYTLLRDCVRPDDLERCIPEPKMAEWRFTNGWLAEYAKDVAERLAALRAEQDECGS